MRCKYPIEIVTWDDHYSKDSWVAVQDHDNDSMSVISVGFLVKEDEKAITLVLNLGEDDIVSCAMTILKANIKTRKKVRNGVTQQRRTRSAVSKDKPNEAVARRSPPVDVMDKKGSD